MVCSKLPPKKIGGAEKQTLFIQYYDWSMLMTDEEVLSKTITFLRFPLIVAVVFIHIEMTNVVINGNLLVEKGEFLVYDLLFHVLSKKVTDIAVPLFFFMAGFLFFYIQRSRERNI